MLHRAKTRGSGRADGVVDRGAVAIQNFLPPLVGCRHREVVTMPREEMRCQCGLGEETNQIVSWKMAGVFSPRPPRPAPMPMGQVGPQPFFLFSSSARKLRIALLRVWRGF